MVGRERGVVQLSNPSRRRCSTQDSGRPIRVGRSAVSSTGWRPWRMASTMSGARKASGKHRLTSPWSTPWRVTRSPTEDATPVRSSSDQRCARARLPDLLLGMAPKVGRPRPQRGGALLGDLESVQGAWLQFWRIGQTKGAAPELSPKATAHKTWGSRHSGRAGEPAVSAVAGVGRP